MTDNTTADYWSARVASGLTQLRASHRERVRHLNRVAEGEESLTEEQRASLKQSERVAREVLAEMTEGGVKQRSRVVTMDEVSATREALPAPLREAYELLFCAAYGSDPSVSIGNPVVNRAAGRRVTRTSTSQPEGAGGAAAPSTKRFGQDRRSMIKDQRAYQEKRKIDRRLARIAKDIREFVLGVETTYSVHTCERCARIGEQEWGFCPWCGYRMIEREN